MKKIAVAVAASMLATAAYAQSSTTVIREGGTTVEKRTVETSSPTVIEKRTVTTTGSVGCRSKTVKKTDEFGDTTTKHKTEC